MQKSSHKFSYGTDWQEKSNLQLMMWCAATHETAQKDLSELSLPVDIPCVDTAIKTRCYQQPISWREFNVLYPIGMPMKGTYLRLQITSIPQCYSTVITACCKNTGIQEPERRIHSATILSIYLFICVFFNNAEGSSDYIESNDGMINE
jgi:hypothetical protein